MIKSMWWKHRSVFQDNLTYIRNDIVKIIFVGILHFADRVEEMHEIAKHVPPPLMKGQIFEAANFKVCDKEFYVREIRVYIKYGLPSSMQDELEDNK